MKKEYDFSEAEADPYIENLRTPESIAAGAADDGEMGSIYCSKICAFDAKLGLKKTPNLFDPDALTDGGGRGNVQI